MDSLPLQKSKKPIVNGLKALLIIVLLFAISFIAFLHWNSEAIVRKASHIIQLQLQDTLLYESAELQWIRFFPDLALEFQGFTIGAPQNPLVDSGNVSVIFGIWPLLSGYIIINKLQLENARINVIHQNGKWSFDLLKEKQTSDLQKANASSQDQNKGWNALLHKLEIKNSHLYFHDGEDIIFNLQVADTELTGNISNDYIETSIIFKGELYGLENKSLKQSQTLAVSMTGKFIFDPKQNEQEIRELKLETNNTLIELDGIIQNQQFGKLVDLEIKWDEEDANDLIEILSSFGVDRFNEYTIQGISTGTASISGTFSKSQTPRISFVSVLKKGSVKFPGNGGNMKNILLDIKYDSGEKASGERSYVHLDLQESSFHGKPLRASMSITNFKYPVLDANMQGHFPAGLLNLAMQSSSLQFQDGSIEANNYTVEQLPVKNVNAKKLIEKSYGLLEASDLKFTYQKDQIHIKNGNIKLDKTGTMNIMMDEFAWNKAIGEKIKGDLKFSGTTVDFVVAGNHSNGEIEAKGKIIGFGVQPVLNSEWTVKDINITELLSSFENFGQSFITSSHLDGIANIWAHSIIPYDTDGTIRKKEIFIRSAIDIKNGRLKNLKTLEDFGRYIHLDDLRDIRFNEMRNYLKIENEQVYLPVMFIQSSAINLSVNGVHSFDHKILYHFKINAGQAAANKLKQSDPFKRLKKARKSGWINFYYVIDGTVENPQYEQSRDAVITSFEQSSSLKDDLRKDLVKQFGHEIYWLEPNEWEDIPEYR